MNTSPFALFVPDKEIDDGAGATPQVLTSKANAEQYIRKSLECAQAT